MNIKNILQKEDLTKEDLVLLLSTRGEEQALLFQKAKEVKEKYIGNIVYFRGLVEYSNRCGKNCYYCGIRSENKAIDRYTVTDDEVLQAAQIVLDNHYGSMVLQSGECSGKAFTNHITHLIKQIKQFSNNSIGITLSCGEQSEEVYRQWFEAGAHRYLLRIEASNKTVYSKIHPQNKRHDYQRRIDCLDRLRQLGYQVGTGVMIGFPMQSVENLAQDLLFFQSQDIDMVGMGPYLVHNETPLAVQSQECPSLEERFNLSINMIACLRILMKDINIAATTALQTLHPQGREIAIEVGANIVMPNLTPVKYRENYKLYENKPSVNEDAQETKNQLEKRILSINHTIGYDKWGDSVHFGSKKLKSL
jgi:biotin synthase